MLRYRTFRNTDPPAVAAIWRSRAGQAGLIQPVSVDLFEQFVFGKLYFDYQGLVLAFDDDKPVGLAHAGFGPNDQRSGIGTTTGVISILLVRPEYEQAEVAGEMLSRCEAYLAERGAQVIYGGGHCPNSPFYVGLYGGSQPAGVLESETPLRDLYKERGYATVQQPVILRQNLTSFRAPVDRVQMQCRRRLLVQVIVDPPTRDWWDASTLGDLDISRFELVPRGGDAPVAYATVRTMDGMSGPASGGPVIGLMDVFVDPSQRRQGLATFLVSEICRTLVGQGVASVEAQTVEEDAMAMGLFRKLGFQEAGRGEVFKKEIAAAGA